MAEEKKNDKSVVCVVCCKKLLSTNHDFPTANMRREYAGIGICVDDKPFAIFGAGKFMITTTKKRLDV